MEQRTFIAVADAYIDESSPEDNFGDADTLEIDSSPSSKWSLLRFDVNGIPEGAQVSTAVLRLTVEDISDFGGSVHTAEGSWNELTVNWLNAPPIGNKLAEVSSSDLVGVWGEARLTSAVSSNGLVDVYITTSSSDGVDYYSLESEFPPTLDVWWSTTAELSPTISETPDIQDDPVLVGAADVASCASSGDEATAELLDLIPGTVFVAGDAAYPHGTPDQFTNCYGSSWGRHKDRTRPAPGNHEYRTSGALGYFNYFGAAAGEPGKGYYSYDLGQWHIIVLNSNCTQVGGCDAGSPQEQWLRADLAASVTFCTLAYWHHPLFSSGVEHGGDDDVRDLWLALYTYGAEVVMNGHEHIYERFTPQDPDGNVDLQHGIRQFIVGLGGDSLYTIRANPVANSQVRFADDYGVLKLTLHPAAYDWEFVTVEGSEFTDEGRTPCH